MTISVIIPTYNGEKYLPKLLESLKKQTVLFELLIIDSSSIDNTVSISQKYTDNIIIISHNEFDHGGTRTQAAKATTGDIVVFLTQDALPFDIYTLEKITECFQNASIGASYGRQIAYESTNIFGKHLRIFNYPAYSYIRTFEDKSMYGIKTAFLSDSFAAYRRTSLKDIGWFKNGLIIGEDAHAGANILLKGESLAYVSDAKVYHSHSYTLLQEFKRYFDTGVFHNQEKWLLDTFGKPEGEAGRYIKSELAYLLKEKEFFRIPEFFLRNALKYFSYKLGQQYKILPISLVKKLSLHPLWWDTYKLKKSL